MSRGSGYCTRVPIKLRGHEYEPGEEISDRHLGAHAKVDYVHRDGTLWAHRPAGAAGAARMEQLDGGAPTAKALVHAGLAEPIES